jgi:uncharacterized protein (UPF0332 family)
VKEQSSAFLEKARSFLAKAQDLLDMHHWPDEAGRAAYLAGLHGAQALIFERTGNIIKRHRGVQREFGRLTQDDSRFDRELRAFLGRTYDLKAIADYETGPDAEVSVARAQQATAIARRFIDVVAAVLQEPEPQRSR